MEKQIINLEKEIEEGNIVAVNINNFQVITPAVEVNKKSDAMVYKLTSFTNYEEETPIYTILKKAYNDTYIEYLTGKKVKVIPNEDLYQEEKKANDKNDANRNSHHYDLIKFSTIRGYFNGLYEISYLIKKNDLENISPNILHKFYNLLQNRYKVETYLLEKAKLYEGIIDKVFNYYGGRNRFILPLSEIKRVHFYKKNETQKIGIAAVDFKNIYFKDEIDSYCILEATNFIIESGSLDYRVFKEINSGLTISYIDNKNNENSYFYYETDIANMYDYYKANPLVIDKFPTESIISLKEESLMLYNQEYISSLLEMLSNIARNQIGNRELINYGYEQATAENAIYDFIKLTKKPDNSN